MAEIAALNSLLNCKWKVRREEPCFHKSPFFPLLKGVGEIGYPQEDSKAAFLLEFISLDIRFMLCCKVTQTLTADLGLVTV